LSVPSARVYTTRDRDLDAALDIAVAAGLTEPDASQPRRLHALAVYGARCLEREQERAEILASYEQLSADEERLQAIRGSVLAAAEDGIL
jgi:hypothetical protein